MGIIYKATNNSNWRELYRAKVEIKTETLLLPTGYKMNFTKILNNILITINSPGQNNILSSTIIGITSKRIALELARAILGKYYTLNLERINNE